MAWASACTQAVCSGDNEEENENEFAILQALFDLEATNAELKADLRDLYITAAKEIEIHGTARKAIIVHVSRLLYPKHPSQLQQEHLYPDTQSWCSSPADCTTTACQWICIGATLTWQLATLD